MKTLLAVLRFVGIGAVCATAPFAILSFAEPTSVAQSATPLEWSSYAGAANHACYYHHGVAQVAESSYYQNVSTAVCRDGWAEDITGLIP